MATILKDIVFQVFAKRQDEDETDPDESLEAGEKEIWTSWALFILIVLLITALFVSYILKQRKIQAVHETVLSIFAGMVVGLIIRKLPGTSVQKSVSFDYQFFFNLLLPPIILASGYELHQANFFRNIGSILTFAFAGTFISALVLGLVLYLWTRMGLEGLEISFIEAFSVGATLSATDPVTILAIFNVYKVEPKLYTVIFGESILNDAIAIVLFETAQRYRPGSAAGSLTVLSLFEAIGIFLIVFFGSLVIGVVVGILTALGLKHTYVRRDPKIESCLIILIAYACYFFSNGVHMSGIVSLLFCGITLKHYAYYNMSRRTQLTTKYIFQVMAQLSENFIFIYLGLDLFTEEHPFKPIFIMVTVVGICVARYLSVFPLSKGINWVNRYRARRSGRDVTDELPPAYQAMIFWAGLRGAVGVALAAGLEGTNAPALRATVLVVVVLTVIIFGGTTARMLEIMEIRTGVVEEIDSDDEFDIEMTNGGTYYKRSGTGIGHTPRRNGLPIPLDSVEPGHSLGRAGEGISSGSTGRLTPQPAEASSSLAARKKKPSYSSRDRKARSRDNASSQKLLGSRSTSQSGSASSSNGADGEIGRSRNRGRRARAMTEGNVDIDDFDLGLDGFSDDDLPPAASRSVRSRTASQQGILSGHIGSAGEGPPTDSGQAHSSTFAGATSAFRDLLSGSGERDHGAWFQQLDEDYIKPTLLLDPGSSRNKGHDAV